MDRADFSAHLAEYGAMAQQALLDWLPRQEPDRHLYGPMRAFIETSGKGLRPALMIATCRAFGGSAEDVLTSAAALELLHNAFLIHDDIEDESEFRRGLPCVHTAMGVPLAINVGDAMQTMALRLLRRNADHLPPDVVARIFDEFDHLLSESIEGQAMELGWIKDNDLTVAPTDYLRMTLKKTCWYSFIHPCRAGTLIARPDSTNLDAFNAFGFYLGAAFQIQDDVLNLVGEQAKYGKEIGGDIYEGKRTLMLARLAANAEPDERETLSRFLATPRTGRDQKDVAWVLSRMQCHDCIDYGRQAAGELIEAARAAFPIAFADAKGPDRDFIGYLIDYVVQRNS
jgi:geranylgeranyl diphosphate synthase, type II